MASAVWIRLVASVRSRVTALTVDSALAAVLPSDFSKYSENYVEKTFYFRYTESNNHTKEFPFQKIAAQYFK